MKRPDEAQFHKKMADTSAASASTTTPSSDKDAAEALHFEKALAGATNFYPSGPLCWGPLQWMTLHQMIRGFPNNPSPEKQAALKAYVMALVDLLPCSICAVHWKDIAPTVKTASKADALKWSIDVHNSVNARTGKKVLSYAEALDVIMSQCKNNALSISTLSDAETKEKHCGSTAKQHAAVYALAATAAVLLVATLVFIILYVRAKKSGRT